MNKAAAALLLLGLLPCATAAAPARHHRAAAPASAVRGGGGVSEARLLAQAVAEDSAHWIMNRYDPGSLTGVEVVARTPGGGATVRGNYTFNGGSGGWVEAEIAGGRISCLRYWDTGSCDPVRWATQGQPARSGTAAAGPLRAPETASPSDRTRYQTALQCVAVAAQVVVLLRIDPEAAGETNLVEGMAFDAGEESDSIAVQTGSRLGKSPQTIQAEETRATHGYRAHIETIPPRRRMASADHDLTVCTRALGVEF